VAALRGQPANAKARVMSKVIQWRDALRDSELDRTAKLVGHTLSTYMNGQGFAHPSKTTLARGASLGRPQQKGNTAVDGAIDRLEQAGFLSIERGRTRQGFKYSAVFPRRDGGIDSHATTGESETADSLADLQVFPRADDGYSLAERSVFPRPGEGEIVESENQAVQSAQAADGVDTDGKTFTPSLQAELTKSPFGRIVLDRIAGGLLTSIDDALEPPAREAHLDGDHYLDDIYADLNDRGVA
jgi:hypothetical protein